MTVVYVDSVFVLNAVMDYLLLLVTARLAGIPLRRGRYIGAALAGGAYAVAVFLPGLGFLAASPVKLAAGLLLAVAAFGGEARFFRLALLFFLASSAMAGCVLGLGLLAGSRVPVVNGVFYTDVDARVLLIAAAAAYLVLAVVFRASAHHAAAGNLLPVRVGLNGRAAALTALWDTGSALWEPGGGEAVLVLAPGVLDGLLPPEVRPLVAAGSLRSPADALEPLRRAAPALRPRLLPYRAVGAGGLLLAVRLDWAEIGGRRYPGLTAALSPTALGDGYTALWGGKGGDHGSAAGKTFRTAGAAAAVGTAAPGRDPLHRRQRHPAPAPEPGAGGGAGGAPRGRGGPEGAHRAQPAAGGVHRPAV